MVPNAFVLTYKPLPTGSNDQATFWLGSKLLKTVSLMGALLLIAALNSATTASLKAGEIPVLSFVLILAPGAGREICSSGIFDVARDCQVPRQPFQLRLLDAGAVAAGTAISAQARNQRTR